MRGAEAGVGGRSPARAAVLAGAWGRVRLPLAGTCLLAGVLLLGFPVWSGWWARHVQSVAAAEFRAQIHAQTRDPARRGGAAAALSAPAAGVLPLPGLTPGSPSPSGSGSPPVSRPGSVLAQLRIPSIGVDQFVLRGLTYAPAVWTRLLRDGPGHLAGSALPGQPGNVVIFGHLNIWGSVFYHLDQVRPGDAVVLSDSAGTFTYTVTGRESIAATDLAAVAPRHAGPAVLQLVTCESVFQNDRLVVEARLTGTVPPAPA